MRISGKAPAQSGPCVLQAQVLAVMGQTKEAEKITERIVSEEAGCLECYRLLSAIYSKQEAHKKVPHPLCPLCTQLQWHAASVPGKSGMPQAGISASQELLTDAP